MAKMHMPPSLRLMPKPLTWAAAVNTSTEVLSHWRDERRMGLKLRLRIIRRAVQYKIARLLPCGEITEVQGALTSRSLLDLHDQRLHLTQHPRISLGEIVGNLSARIDNFGERRTKPGVGR
jgi:hypothetical protein